MSWPYPVFMAAAILTGLVVARLQGDRLPLSGRQRLAVAIGAFVGGMIGAKLPYVFSDWDKLASGEAWIEGGKTITTGLVGGYFGVELAKRIAGISVRTGDSLCVPLAAALAVGRLACLVGGCCYGVACSLPWAMDFGDGVRRHPTQLYEFVFHATSAVVLFVLRRHGLFRTNLVKLYIVAYLIFRFFTEFIRPEPRILFGWTLYQAAAGLFIPLFLVLAWRDRRLASAGGP